MQWRPERDESLILAEAVEQKKEEHGDERVDERRDEEMHVKPRLRLRQQNAPRENHQALMCHEESGGDREPRRGMFGVQPRADGRSEIPDDRFRDAIKPQRNRRAAKAVLQKTHDHAQEESGGRISPAEAGKNPPPE